MSAQVVWLIVAVMAFSFAALIAVLVFVSSEKTEARKEAQRLREDQLDVLKIAAYIETGRRY